VAIATGGNGGIGEGLAPGRLECSVAVVVAGRNATNAAGSIHAEILKTGDPSCLSVISTMANAAVERPPCIDLAEPSLYAHSAVG